MLSSQAYTEAFYIVNLMSEEQKKNREEYLIKKMKQTVGKQVAHNEETRQELEGPDKTFVVEEGDVEK